MKWLYGIIGLIVVGGGIWYAMNMNGDANDATIQTAEQANTQDAPSNESQQFRGSLKDLMARSGSWRCDISVTTEGVTASGTTYVAQGKVRADFVSEVPQFGSVASPMIMRDNTAYTWTDMMNQGFKFPIQGAEVEPEVSAEVAAQMNQAYDYSCAAWPTDESKFALPSDITF
jgi:hypothetical protein